MHLYFDFVKATTNWETPPPPPQFKTKWKILFKKLPKKKKCEAKVL